MSFQNLKLIEPILKALKEEGYENPTPIQAQSIPILLSRKDLLGCAQTGTGKTAAFAIPLLQLLCEEAAGVKENTTLRSMRPIKALVLTPTRELAIQIGDSFTAYGRHTGIKNLVIFGGVPQNPQVQALKSGIDVLIATPGRLLDLIDQRFINLRDIQFFVLDEADRMLDMGFVHDVKKVLKLLPQKKQALFFSATMPPEIQKLASTILVDPSKVEVTPVSSTAETIQQSLYFVEKKDKRSLLLHVLKTQPIVTALVFTRTKHGADKVAQGLTRAGIRAEAIHGNKSQNARQRALQNFKSRQTRILVATDIAARGIDIDELTHVINFEIPNVPETYVHRIGRTGRAGASGIALSFCDAEETEFVRDIEKLISRPIPVVEDHPHVMVGGVSIRPAAVTNNGNGNNGRGNQQGNGRNSQQNNRRNNQPGNERGRDRQQQQQQRPKPTPPVKRAPQPEGVSRDAQPEAVKREPQQEGVKREPQQEHAKREPQQSAVKRAPQPAPAKRAPQPAQPAQQPARAVKQPESTEFPFAVNRSEGDEKW